MNILRRLSILVLVAGLALACSTTPDDTSLVGVTLLNKQDVFYQELEAGMRAEAERQGMRLLVQSAEKDLAAQTAQVESFIVRGVDALIACPVDSRGIAQALERARREGVAIFTADIAAEGVDQALGRDDVVVVAYDAIPDARAAHASGVWWGRFSCFVPSWRWPPRRTYF